MSIGNGHAFCVEVSHGKVFRKYFDGRVRTMWKQIVSSLDDRRWHRRPSALHEPTANINFMAKVMERQKGCAHALSSIALKSVSREHFISVEPSNAFDVLWIEWWNGQTFCLNTELLPKHRSNLLTVYHIHLQSHLFYRLNTPCSIFFHFFHSLLPASRTLFDGNVYKSYHGCDWM